MCIRDRIQPTLEYPLKKQTELDIFYKFDKNGLINFEPFQFDNSEIKIQIVKNQFHPKECNVVLSFTTKQSMNLVFRKNRDDKYKYIKLDDTVIRLKKDSEISSEFTRELSEAKCQKLKQEKELTLQMIGELMEKEYEEQYKNCLLYTSPSPRDLSTSRMPSSA